MIGVGDRQGKVHPGPASALLRTISGLENDKADQALDGPNPYTPPMKPSTKSFYVTAVRRALDRVIAGLDESLDLESLAREAALSPLHFHKVFRGMVGETPLEMHRRLRLERAAQRLEHGDHTVTSVALDAGYETHEAFTRAFGRRFGCSPSEFRRRRLADRSCDGMSAVDGRLAARSGIHFGVALTDELFETLLPEETTMDVTITEERDIRVAALRHVGPYHTIGETFGELSGICAAAGLFGPGTRMIGLYHDDPETTPESELRSDAAVTVGEGVTIPERLTEMRIPAGTYARTTHVGPYEGLGDKWAKLMGEWLPQSERRVGTTVCYEVYLDDPRTTPPAQLRTDIFLPLDE